MEHEIHQFELSEKAKRLSEFYKNTDIADMDPDEFPDDLKDLKAEIEALANDAAMAPPKQPEEDEYRELVTINVPYNILLQMIRAAQTAANDQHLEIHKLLAVSEVLKDGPMQDEILDKILDSMSLNLLYTHLAAELNRARLAERPAEFVQEGEEGNYEIAELPLPDSLTGKIRKDLPELSSMGLEQIVGDQEFDLKWLLGNGEESEDE